MAARRSAPGSDVVKPRAARGRFPYRRHRTMAEVLHAEAMQRAVRGTIALRFIKMRMEDEPRPKPALYSPKFPVADSQTAARARPREVEDRCEGEAPEGTSGSAAGGNTVPANASPARPAARPRIDISHAPSAMEAAAERWRSNTEDPPGLDLAADCAQVEAQGLIFCKCGARFGSEAGGKVPAFFKDNCIEGDCPWRGRK